MARQINLTNVTEQDFGPLAEGKYVAVIEKLEEKTAKSGNEMTVIHARTSTGSFVFINLVWSEKAMPMAKSTLRKLGLDVDSGAINLDDLIGVTFECDVTYKMVDQKDGFGNVIGKSKSDFPNINVLGVVTEEEEAPVVAEVSTPAPSLAGSVIG